MFLHVKKNGMESRLSKERRDRRLGGCLRGEPTHEHRQLLLGAGVVATPQLALVLRRDLEVGHRDAVADEVWHEEVLAEGCVP